MSDSHELVRVRRVGELALVLDATVVFSDGKVSSYIAGIALAVDGGMSGH